ncbi:MAG: hypothetical protein IK031_01095 [Bacteroidales bacterium]|nr:hypothetical protein [Bacteroidales bacterium]
MADRNWNDKLRERMSEFESTPPEGLWEAIETAGAGGGLWSRIFGRRMAPVWWSLAGVAAAVTAFVLLRNTDTYSPVGPESSIIAEAVEQDEMDLEEEFAEDPVDGVSEEAVEAAVKADVEEAVKEAPSADTITEQSPAPDSASSGEPASSEESSAPPAEPAPSEVSPAPSAEPMPSEVSPAPSGVSPAPSEVSPAPSTGGGTVVPLSRSVRRTRPLLAASFVGGGMPGSSVSGTETVYGMSTGTRSSSAARAMALVSRNRPTEITTSQHIDYQLGLLFTFNFTRRLGIESGLQYTRLGSSRYSASGNMLSGTEETLDYLGVPLRVVYTPLKLAFLSAYISAGPELEYGVARSWTSVDNLGRQDSDTGRDFPGDLVLSGSLNAGLQLTPWKHGAFFLQPGVVYRSVSENSSESYYTAHPWSFRLSAGYRVIF